MNKHNKNFKRLLDHIDKLENFLSNLNENAHYETNETNSTNKVNKIKENEIIFNKYFDSYDSVICIEPYMSSDIKSLEYTYIKYESETGTVYVIDDNNITYAFFVYDINWFITLRKNKFSNLIDIGYDQDRLVVTELEDEDE